MLVLPDGMEAAAEELQQLQAVVGPGPASASAGLPAAAEGAAQQQQQPALGAAAVDDGPAVGAVFATRVLRLANLVLLFLEEQQAAAAAAEEVEEAAAAAEGSAAAGGSAAEGGAAAAQAAFAAAYPAAVRQRVAAAATWLCTLCVRCRWPALLRQLLPATTAVGSADAAVEAMDALLPAGLLGTAAAAGSAELLTVLGDWARGAGHAWQLSGMGSRALTPLHLAAALGHRLTHEAAAALVSAVGAAAAAECWHSAHTSGWTPCQVAAAADSLALLSLLGSSAQAPPITAEDRAPGHEEEAPAADATSPPPAPLVLGSPIKGRGSAAEAAAVPTAPPAAAAAASGSGGAGSAAREEAALQLARLRQKEAELAAVAQQDAEQEQVGLLKQHQLELQVEKAGRGTAGGSGMALLSATAAELEAYRKAPMHPAALVAIGGVSILLVLGLAAAVRSGLYD